MIPEKIKTFIQRRQKFSIGVQERLLFKIALIYFILFNLGPLYFLYSAVSGYSELTGWAYWKHVGNYVLVIGCFYYLGNLLLIAFLAMHRFVFMVLLPPLFVISAAITYSICVYKIVFTPAMVQAIYSSPANEASEFAGWPLITWLVCVAMVSVWVVRFYLRKCIQPKILYAICITAALGFCLMTPAGSLGVPFNFLTASLNFALQKVNAPPRHNFDNVAIAADPRVTDDLTEVVVIGESARADHWHMNGYARQTTPFMEAQLANVINFPFATSCGNDTNTSVSCLLTRASPENMNPTHSETSFLGLFRRLGFPVYWVSNNTAAYAQGLTIQQIINTPGEVDKIYQTLMSDSEEHLLAHELLSEAKDARRGETDDNTYPIIDRLLKEHPKKLFLVVHIIGSHWAYFGRYPESYEKYAPVCKEKSYFVCSRESILNAYDNSIAYTDYVLNRIIEKLKGRKAMLWYFSDHGELLGERGLWGHLNPDKGPEQYHIPMLWWGSDRFIKENAGVYEALRRHSKEKVSHSNLFPSLLDCSSARSELINKSLSLCQ